MDGVGGISRPAQGRLHLCRGPALYSRMKRYERRDFLRTGIGAAVGAGSLGFLGSLPRLSAEDLQPGKGFVNFRPEIEPLVRLLEETSRERLLEEVAQRIQAGTTYRELLAAVMLAGVRNIQPRPVGFKFHAVLVVNSAHLASLNAPDEDRWLPLFWALDQFKSSQATDRREGDWTMPAVDEKALPPARKAATAFREAMDGWDEARADVSIAALARTAGAQQIFDLMCRYGARDYRDIGHKAIFVANSWRTLQTIGWQHAEPVLRSLAYALLMHRGGNPAGREARADLPGRRNLKRLNELKPGWNGGKLDPLATRAMLVGLRSADWDQAPAMAVALVNAGASPQSIWDACFAHAAELMMRRPGILSLHACTTTNALRYAFDHCGIEDTRKFLLLQNVAFLTMFRDDATDGVRIDELEPLEAGENPVGDVFADLESDRMAAARRTLGYLQGGGDPRSFIAAAQRLIYLKGRDSHDYKFSSAVLEDHGHVSPGIRDRFLAASVFWLKGSTLDDSPLVARTRAAMG